MRPDKIVLNISRNCLDESLATIAGAARLFALFGFPFILLGTISGIGCITHGPFAPFALSDMAPNFMHAGATNLAVTVMCSVGLVMLIGAITWRYFHHRKTIEMLRRKGVTDFDGDGETDNFANKFLDDL